MPAERTLIIFAHPCPESFGASLCKTVEKTVRASGSEVRLLDLYGMGFNPVMDADERRKYHEPGINEEPVRDHIDSLRWADTLLFVYPTWWFNLPAMLKGWLDRVFVPHVTFIMPTETTPIRPNLRHLKRVGAVTTCGATWFHSKIIGEPGRKTLLRGVRALADPRCKTLYSALYQMDTRSEADLKAYLATVETRVARFLK